MTDTDGAPRAEPTTTAPAAAGDLLTIDEAAEYLKVSAVTISRWRRQGRLPTLKVGPRAVRIRRVDLDRLGQPYHGPLTSLDDAPAPTAAAPTVSSPVVPPARQIPPVARTLARAEQLRDLILLRRHGEFLDAAGDDMGKLRDKRAKRRT